jgi:lipopolysaccharide transport system ATP-binding protein
MNVIKVENISKLYRLGQVGTGSIFHDVNRWWHGVRGKEDPYMRVGEENDRTKKGEGDYVWALKDINFEVAQGEVLGIIGRNGAGKSTLLKILSRTTAPTTGSIKVKGRIASLLEVGTGFHPELSGRDNIFMNGTILGMTRTEIKSKFDEIVEFAGVARYLDTPVKRYSSGMYVRLAFAVAAHLESEILIVDEVLAVGDAEFQKKCLGKMKDVSEKQGRTVLFVSHNIDSVVKLSKKIIVLNRGKISSLNGTGNTSMEYLRGAYEMRAFYEYKFKYLDKLVIEKIWVENSGGNTAHQIDVTEDFYLNMAYEVLSPDLKIFHGINVYNELGAHVFSNHDLDPGYRVNHRECRKYVTRCRIPANFLNEGIFLISFAIMDSSTFEPLILVEEKITIMIFDNISGNSARGNYHGGFPGIVRPILDWDTN